LIANEFGLTSLTCTSFSLDLMSQPCSSKSRDSSICTVAAGEGWRRSLTDCVKNDEVLHQSQGEKEHRTYSKKGKLTVLVTSCVGASF